MPAVAKEIFNAPQIKCITVLYNSRKLRTSCNLYLKSFLLFKNSTLLFYSVLLLSLSGLPVAVKEKNDLNYLV